MDIPVIIIHRGNHDYARIVAQQAKNVAGLSFVIGDGQQFSTDNISSYSSTSKEFESIYEHLSTNGKDIELLCFTRWIVLRDFMKAKNIDVCLHIDSDVLLYSNSTVMWSMYDNFEITLSHRCCGSAAYFTLKGLDKFCSFMMETYNNKSSYDYSRLLSHYHTRQRHGLPGGVCDMTLLEHFGYKNCGIVGEMMHIVSNSTWDHNINESDNGFSMDTHKRIKRVSFSSNIPVVYNERLNRTIVFNSLHFQGPAKRYIPEMAKI